MSWHLAEARRAWRGRPWPTNYRGWSPARSDFDEPTAGRASSAGVHSCTEARPCIRSQAERGGWSGPRPSLPRFRPQMGVIVYQRVPRHDWRVTGDPASTRECPGPVPPAAAGPFAGLRVRQLARRRRHCASSERRLNSSGWRNTTRYRGRRAGLWLALHYLFFQMSTDVVGVSGRLDLFPDRHRHLHLTRLLRRPPLLPRTDTTWRGRAGNVKVLVRGVAATPAGGRSTDLFTGRDLREPAPKVTRAPTVLLLRRYLSYPKPARPFRVQGLPQGGLPTASTAQRSPGDPASPYAPDCLWWAV